MAEKSLNIEQYKVPLEKKKFKNNTERFPDYQAFKNALDQSSMGDLKVEDMKILKQGRRYAVEYSGRVLGFVKGKEQFDNFMTQYLNQLKSKEAAGTTADVQVEISRKKVDVEVTHRLDNLKQDVLVHEIAIVQNIENYESLVLWLKNKRHELKNKIKDLRTQKGDYSDVGDQTIKDMIVIHKEQLDRMDAMDDKIVRLDKRGTSLDQQQTLIDFKSELIGILKLQSTTIHAENLLIIQDKKVQDAVKEQESNKEQEKNKEQTSGGSVSVDSPHDINGVICNNTTDAFAKGGIVGALDYRGAQSNMTRGQREFWKGAANIGMVAGGVYLGWTVLSKAFGVFKGGDDTKEALKWIGGAVAITLGSQVLTGKDPISVLRELANGGDTTKRIKQKIEGHDGIGIGAEVATNIEDCLDCALLLGAVDFKYYLDNKIIQFNAQGDPTIDTYKMNQLIDTKPMNFNASVAKDKLKSLEKDPSLFTKWMNALGLSKNAMESQPTQNAPETYVAKQKEYMGTALDTRKLGDDLKNYKKSDKEQIITHGNVIVNELGISDFHYEVEGKNIRLKTYGESILINPESFSLVDVKVYKCRSLEECLRVANLTNFLKSQFKGKAKTLPAFYVDAIATPGLSISPLSMSLGKSIKFNNADIIDFSHDTKVLSGGWNTTLSQKMPSVEDNKQGYCDMLNGLGVWKVSSFKENNELTGDLEVLSLQEQLKAATNIFNQNMPANIETPKIDKDGKIVLTFERKNIIVDSKNKSFVFDDPNGGKEKIEFDLPKASLIELFLVAGRTQQVIEKCKNKSHRKDDRTELFYVATLMNNPTNAGKLMFDDVDWMHESIWPDISDKELYPILSQEKTQKKYCMMLNGLGVWKDNNPEAIE